MSRTQRYNDFKENLLPLIALEYDVSEHVSDSWSILNTEFGIVDYYPKSDKILIREKNEWIPRGEEWIIINLNIER